MTDWRGYFAVERITANLNEANWILLQDEIRRILTSGNRCHQLLHWRGGPETFTEIIDEDTEITWHNSYIYAANFQESAISFDKFGDKLAAVFNVDVEDISYTTTIQDGSIVATYKYGANNRFRLALLGCTSDDDLGTWQETHDAVLALAAEWDSEVVG
jgi:hypothetical protein